MPGRELIPAHHDRARAERGAARRPARRGLDPRLRRARSRARGATSRRTGHARSCSRSSTRRGRAGGGARRSRRVQAPPGATRREAPAEGVRPGPAPADHESLEAIDPAGLGVSAREVAANQRSRSSHGTAAFAGEVEGSTKSVVAPSIRSCTPCCGPLAEHAPVRLLADECDHAGSSSSAIRSSRSALPAKSPRAEVARAARRPVGRVRQPEAEVEQRELLVRLELARGEPRRMQQPPEVVARIRECAAAAATRDPGLMPQKTTRTPGARTSGTAGSAQAASGSRASSRSSRSSRSFSPTSLDSADTLLAAGAPSRSPRCRASRSSARSTLPR